MFAYSSPGYPGEEFKLTRERVRQIREKAIAKLKGYPGTEILRTYVV